MRARHLMIALALVTVILAAAVAAPAAPGDDWTDWRGPARDGRSPATGLPENWSPEGENVAWEVPYGGRSAPVVHGDHLYLQNESGEGTEMRERVMALDADTGTVVWEQQFNITLSDVPPHRVGWASPAVDPETGNVYSLSVDGVVRGFTRDGGKLWELPLGEQFGYASTHGGRTVSPVIVEDLVIVSGITGGWGSFARGQHRIIALDKTEGRVAWVGLTEGQPYDTTFSPPLVTEIGGRLLLLLGGGDGAAHAFEARTGRHIWRFPFSKRGINSGVLVAGDTAFVSHSEENLADSAMGMVAAIDATGSGELGADSVRWSTLGLLAGFSSPVLDGDRYYQVDNSANLIALDASSGTELWRESLGTIQRASPVLADGKLYVGTANGGFYIIRPGADGAEILDHEDLGDEADPEEIIGSVAVAHGRVYLATTERTFAIGPAGDRAGAPDPAPPRPAASSAAVTHATIYPQELVVAPGQQVQFEARLFDSLGNHVRTQRAGAWSISEGAGTIDAQGLLTAAGVARPAEVKVAVDGVEAAARLRVIPPLPWTYTAAQMSGVPPYWVGALGKFHVVDEDGRKVLLKTNDNPFLKRTKVFLGGSDLHDYTVSIDFKTAMDRRRLGDAGLLAQGYAFTAYGAHRQVSLQSWQPETTRSITLPYVIEPDVWYRMVLRTDNLDDGRIRVRGKIWPVADPEPAEWTIDHSDDLGERAGSPGFYADAHALVSFDNLHVQANQ